MITLILVSWKRFKNLDRIIETWLKEPEITEVILWDNSGKYQTTRDITVINSQVNYNLSIRYAIAAMAKNDIVLNADDDILPGKGLPAKFLAHFAEDRMLGISGIQWGGSWGESTMLQGNKFARAKRIDYIGGPITMIHKKHLLGHDYSKFSKYQAEINLQAFLPRSLVERWVVPIDYYYLPEALDENALGLQPETASECDRLCRLNPPQPRRRLL